MAAGVQKQLGGIEEVSVGSNVIGRGFLSSPWWSTIGLRVN
jgi:hypothetical protein